MTEATEDVEQQVQALTGPRLDLAVGRIWGHCRRNAHSLDSERHCRLIRRIVEAAARDSRELLKDALKSLKAVRAENRELKRRLRSADAVADAAAEDEGYIRLWPRQHDAYLAIVNHLKKHGWPPSHKQIAKALGLANSSCLAPTMKALEKAGVISREASWDRHHPRLITVLVRPELVRRRARGKLKEPSS